MDDLRLIFGVLAGILGIAASIPYIYTILRGETRPERAAMIIWFLTTAIIFFSYWAEGAKESLWFVLGDFIVGIVMLALSVKHGYKWVRQRDVPAILIALLGLGLWVATGEPILALLLNVFVDAVGSVLVVIKSYEAPNTENIFAWSVYALASMFAIASVGKLDFALLVYPIYALVASLAIVGVVFVRRKQLA